MATTIQDYFEDFRDRPDLLKSFAIALSKGNKFNLEEAAKEVFGSYISSARKRKSVVGRLFEDPKCLGVIYRTWVEVAESRSARSRSTKDLRKAEELGLTDRQIAFCYALVENGGNRRDAYYEAGYEASDHSSPVAQLLANPRVREFRDYLLGGKLSERRVRLDRVLDQLHEVADGTITDYIRIGQDGEFVLLPSEEWKNPGAVASIEISPTKSGAPRVRLDSHPKVSALSTLVKAYGADFDLNKVFASLLQYGFRIVSLPTEVEAYLIVDAKSLGEDISSSGLIALFQEQTANRLEA
jgi:phage terminase small subunit